MLKLKYGNTNTYLIPCEHGYLLVDTDYAGTFRAFCQAMKGVGLQIGKIRYVMATHYHPDHMGLIPDLMRQGVKLLLLDVQKDWVHFSDRIFERGKIPFTPISEDLADIVSIRDSSAFLASIGISGEIISTPSHSPDSVSLILDDAENASQSPVRACIAGDLEPYEYIEAYPANSPLKTDWDKVMSYHPDRICYAHVNEKREC